MIGPHVVTYDGDNIACSCGEVLKPPHREGWWWGERWNVAEAHATQGTTH